MTATEDDPGDGDDFRLWAIYRRVYSRCLASQFWNANARCGQRAAYEGKTIVLGASSRARRDQHYTPLGTMSGAEVVVNAIRSFLLHPNQEEHGIVTALLRKLGLVMLATPIWFGFFVAQSFLKQGRPSTGRGAVWRTTLIIAAFLVALCFAIAITSVAAYSSFTVLIAVLAIAIDQYVEVMTTCVLHPAEARLEHWLGVHRQQ